MSTRLLPLLFSQSLMLLPLVCAAAPQPNIVVIMADDLGWRDLHGYGNDQVDTPQLDQLAKEGMKFTQAYAASPVCTPTRAAMMTGQSPARLGITNHAPGNPDGFALPGSNLQEPQTVRHLALSYTTIAERLVAAGYATAHVGKWHLSHVARGEKAVAEIDLRPEKQRFGLNIGGGSSGGPPSYFAPYRNPAMVDGKAGEYLPERLADEAIAFIRQHKSGPFFLNWWPYSVHYPMEAREDLIAKYRQRTAIKDPIYAAMIEAMDTAIGRFLKALDEAGLRENTLVLFKSDNGGYNGDNRPLRGLKGMLYEGGIRVPWIVRWPGRVRPGAICDTPIISTDCYPTLLEAAGLPPTPNHSLDGRSLMPVFKESGELGRDTLFCRYPNYAFHKLNRLGSALREGDFKLIHYYDTDELELYNLGQDIGETKNLASKSPELAQRLAAKLDAWLRDTGARLPVSRAKIEYEKRAINGWNVYLSKKVLEKESAVTERALKFLAVQLAEIISVVPAAAVTELQKVPLYFNPEYPGVRPRAEYHPDADWLRENGRDPGMAKAVEFTNTTIFEQEVNRMPNFALHELAHAYHHRVLRLSFANPQVRAAYQKAKSSGKYDRVERHLGNGRPNTFESAYAMTTPQEYFAETSEAFFSTNDFFPFNRAELKQHDPEMFSLLRELWKTATNP